ncbi:ogr/Delta-like zinc finger family protein [Iodobacter sp.]|uniref:ogr/Delta-like zinc finger family protein n=1 Tax=Iodobacter sp. TaxID=1915058 RepID=UPI0025FA8B3F|nr:ogr/Delta-like zinc finger family protein [Iodobacter sp.]
MALEILCPTCGGKTSTRTSEEFGPLLKKAKLVCRNCGRHSYFTGEITEHFDIVLSRNMAIHTFAERPAAANDGAKDQLSLTL